MRLSSTPKECGGENHSGHRRRGLHWFGGSAEIIQHTADRVVVVDKLTYAGNLMSLAPVAQDARFAFEQVDICDRAELDRIFVSINRIR